MESYKKEFIEFMVESDVLKFGSFTLKSGRKSPFFMNAGAYVTGTQLRRLGTYYAKAIHDNYGLDFDVLFGPAYKGIPLSVATSMAISELYGADVRYSANRKEAKDHGDTGTVSYTHLDVYKRQPMRSGIWAESGWEAEAMLVSMKILQRLIPILSLIHILFQRLQGTPAD